MPKAKTASTELQTGLACWRHPSSLLDMQSKRRFQKERDWVNSSLGHIATRSWGNLSMSKHNHMERRIGNYFQINQYTGMSIHYINEYTLVQCIILNQIPSFVVKLEILSDCSIQYRVHSLMSLLCSRSFSDIYPKVQLSLLRRCDLITKHVYICLWYLRQQYSNSVLVSKFWLDWSACTKAFNAIVYFLFTVCFVIVRWHD